MKFKVGQIWRDRQGDAHRITKTDGDHYHIDSPQPVEAVGTDGEIRKFTVDGRFRERGVETGVDLVELVEDSPVEESLLNFKVGQIWETRDKNRCEIVSVNEKYTYNGDPQPIRVRFDNGTLENYSKNGMFVSSPGGWDLVTLIEDVEVSDNSELEERIAELERQLEETILERDQFKESSTDLFNECQSFKVANNELQEKLNNASLNLALEKGITSSYKVKVEAFRDRLEEEKQDNTELAKTCVQLQHALMEFKTFSGEIKLADFSVKTKKTLLGKIFG